jgi:hypothetical protein
MNPQPLLASWQRTDVLLLLVFAQLTLLALTGLLIAHRLAGRASTAYPRQRPDRQETPGRAQPPIHFALEPAGGNEDPHDLFRRIAINAAQRTIGDLTPLQGSVDPAYLLFREDDTRRRLLLAADKNPRASLKALGLRPSRRRYPAYPLAASYSIALAGAWHALAVQLDLSAWPPPTAGWTLVELPPEELSE